MTKIQLRNLNQTSAAKYWPNYSFKIRTKLQLQILPELQLQNLDQTLCSRSEHTFCFMTKPQLPNLQQTVANMILIINISNINNINKFWVGTCKGHMYLLYFKSEKSAILYKLSVCKFWHRCLCYLNQQICYFSQLFALRLVKSWEWWRKTRRLWKNRSLFNILLSWSHSDALNKTRGTLACLCLDNKSKYCLFWNLCLKIVVFRHSSW